MADQFQQYDEVLPGAAERILVMAEKEQAIRHVNTTRLVKSQTFQNYFGPIFGFLTTIGFGLMGYALIMAGKDIQGFAAIILAITSLLGSVASVFKKK